MSRTLEVALEKAQRTNINISETPKSLRIEIMDAAVLWPDFSGRITQFHKVLGEKRSFNIVLNEGMFNALKHLEESRGIRFRIHEADLYSAQDIAAKGCEQVKVFYINVKVNLTGSYPPTITLFTEVQDPKTGIPTRSRNTLVGDSINNLDHITIVTADCDVNIYQSNPEVEFVSAYLKKLNVSQEVQLEFGGRWDGWENINDEEEIPLGSTQEELK